MLESSEPFNNFNWSTLKRKDVRDPTPVLFVVLGLVSQWRRWGRVLKSGRQRRADLEQRGDAGGGNSTPNAQILTNFLKWRRVSHQVHYYCGWAPSPSSLALLLARDLVSSRLHRPTSIGDTNGGSDPPPFALIQV